MLAFACGGRLPTLPELLAAYELPTVRAQAFDQLVVAQTGDEPLHRQEWLATTPAVHGAELRGSRPSFFVSRLVNLATVHRSPLGDFIVNDMAPVAGEPGRARLAMFRIVFPSASDTSPGPCR